LGDGLLGPLVPLELLGVGRLGLGEEGSPVLPAQEALAGEEGQVAAHRGLGNPEALGQLPGT
jgi:hypothetical protein